MHIGSLIKQRALELRFGPSELAEIINTSKQNVYSIYKRKSIDTEVLFRLSVALKYNFFDAYKDRLRNNGLEIESGNTISLELQKKKELEKELSILQEKCDLLTKLNFFMERNLSEKKID